MALPAIPAAVWFWGAVIGGGGYVASRGVGAMTDRVEAASDVLIALGVGFVAMKVTDNEFVGIAAGAATFGYLKHQEEGG